MTFDGILFTIIAAIVAFSALAVVLTRDVVRCAVWLLFTLIGTSLLYFLLGAEFLGAAQLIVYVGGTLVLVIFGVMLTATAPFRQIRASVVEKLVAGGIAGGLFVLLAGVSLDLGQSSASLAEKPDLPATVEIGLGFLGFTEGDRAAYLFPFEIVSVHLLVVLIGAAYLARAKRKAPPKDVPQP